MFPAFALRLRTIYELLLLWMLLTKFNRVCLSDLNVLKPIFRENGFFAKPMRNFTKKF